MGNIVWGVTGLSHDASIAVFDNDELVFASQSERYSRIKNDKDLNQDIVDDALRFGAPERVYFYERPLVKKTRQIRSGQWHLLFSESPRAHLKKFGVIAPITYTDHHLSHAAGGYYSSSFTNASVLCVDSIGEWNTMTIWEGHDDKLIRKYAQNYPHSVGLWYSAMTQRIGLKPQEHEYILMGMAALGDASRFRDRIIEDFFKKLPTVDDPSVLFVDNLHRGCMWWAEEITEDDYADVAAAVQSVFETIIETIFKHVRKYYPSRNLVFMGGTALNCVANRLALPIFDNVWIMPNCGDSGSSVGAVLAHTKKRILYSPYIGHNIEGAYPVEEVIEQLLTRRVVGVAAGRAEFGPRALGHRSLLADPRGDDIKDLVNTYKQREKFRPFAPAILEEFVADYFDVSPDFRSPFMQYTVVCKDPKSFPAVVHYDNTSRVQTVGKNDGGFRMLLERWYELTGCPMILNTSLNIKSEPILNTREDAIRWEETYGIPVVVPNADNIQ